MFTKSFRLNLSTCLYDPTLQRYSLEKIRFRETAVFISFVHIRPTSGNQMWPKLPKSTSTRQDILFAPTPKSLRPSVTKNQPGKTPFENRCFWTFWQNSAISGGRIWPKLSKDTSTRHDLSYEPILLFCIVQYTIDVSRTSIPRSFWPSVTKKQPGNVRFENFWPNSNLTFHIVAVFA